MQKRRTLTWPRVRVREGHRYYQVDRLVEGVWVLVGFFPFPKSSILHEADKDLAYDRALALALELQEMRHIINK